MNTEELKNVFNKSLKDCLTIQEEKAGVELVNLIEEIASKALKAQEVAFHKTLKERQEHLNALIKLYKFESPEMDSIEIDMDMGIRKNVLSNESLFDKKFEVLNKLSQFAEGKPYIEGDKGFISQYFEINFVGISIKYGQQVKTPILLFKSNPPIGTESIYRYTVPDYISIEDAKKFRELDFQVSASIKAIQETKIKELADTFVARVKSTL